MRGIKLGEHCPRNFNGDKYKWKYHVDEDFDAAVGFVLISYLKAFVMPSTNRFPATIFAMVLGLTFPLNGFSRSVNKCQTATIE